MDYSKEIAQTVENFLKVDEWKFDFDEEFGVFESGVMVKNAIEFAPIYIFIRDNNFTVYMDLGIQVPKRKRTKIATEAMRLNCGMILGGFEMDLERGTLRYKCTVDCEGALPCFDVIRNSIYTGVLMLTEHGEDLIALTK